MRHVRWLLLALLTTLAVGQTPWQNALSIGTSVTSAQVLAQYSPSSYAGRTVATTDFGTLISDGARWHALNPPIPPAAAVLGYKKMVYCSFPGLVDISYSSATQSRWYSGWGPYSNIPNSSSYALASDGQLELIFPSGGGNNAGLITTETQANSQPVVGNLGYFPFLLGSQGFYIEAAFTLSGNNTDNFAALFLEPQEHNTTQNDHVSGDPAGYERWLEFDVNENGHGTDYSGAYRGALHYWVGGGNVMTITFTSAPSSGATSATLSSNWGGDTLAYPVTFSDSEVKQVTLTNGAATATWTGGLTNTVTTSATVGYASEFTVSNTQTASLDYTTEHIFGLSYDPIGNEVAWWQDGAAQASGSTASANSGVKNWHYFPLIAMQSHGSNTAFTMNLRYVCAWQG